MPGAHLSQRSQSKIAKSARKGGFFDILASKDAVGRLNERKKPVNENGRAALALHALAKMTKNEKYSLVAQKSLDAVSADAFALGAYGATYALAAELLAKEQSF